MSLFAYEAIQPDGTKTKGELEAGSRAEAYRLLDRERLQPISLNEASGRQRSQNKQTKNRWQ